MQAPEKNEDPSAGDGSWQLALVLSESVLRHSPPIRIPMRVAATRGAVMMRMVVEARCGEHERGKVDAPHPAVNG
jgi:hypothetical protein